MRKKRLGDKFDHITLQVMREHLPNIINEKSISKLNLKLKIERSCYVAKADLQFMILLSEHLECQNYRTDLGKHHTIYGYKTIQPQDIAIYLACCKESLFSYGYSKDVFEDQCLKQGVPTLVMMPLIESLFSFVNWTPGTLPEAWLWISESASIRYCMEALL
ncbi:hypothetical protein STEG23_033141 [Scotinomys teguina]